MIKIVVEPEALDLLSFQTKMLQNLQKMRWMERLDINNISYFIIVY